LLSQKTDVTASEEVVLATIQRVLKPIQQFVRGWMIVPETEALAKKLGLRDGHDMWVIGRAGAMGDCTPEAAAAGLGFHGPAGVHAAWERMPAATSPHAVAIAYAELCQDWGTKALAVFDPARMARLDDLGRRILDAADAALGPVFAGWRAVPQPTEVGARASLTMHVLRELRGGAHIAAILASGITPLTAVLASPAPPPRSGPAWAEHLHWVGPFPEVTDHMRAARAAAEALTSRMLIPAFSVLNETELVEFGELCETTRNAIDM
jgi:hypothetical protein